MDILFLRQLRLEVLIGVHEHERLAPQPLIMDLEMSADVARAAASDSIQDALDYSAVASALTDYAAASRFDLIESLAEGCAQLVLNRFSVNWLRLTLHKPRAIGNAESAGLVIERQRPRQ
jgi:dihydroneopterin aldolase